MAFLTHVRAVQVWLAYGANHTLAYCGLFGVAMHIFGVPIGKKKIQQDPTVHGIPEFPMAMYDTFFNDDLFGFVQWHWHEEIQFCTVTKGTFAFYVNEESFRLEEGQGIFINSGCLHMAKPLDVPGGVFACLNLHPKLLTFFPSSVVDSQYVQPVLHAPDFRTVLLSGQEPWHADILQRLLRMHTIYEERAYGYELDLCIEIAQIWRIMVHKMLAFAGSRAYGRVDYQKMKQILSYLHENYREKISLNELAPVANLSVSECCRFFKRIANCTIIEYLTDYRLKHSLELLQFSNMTISEIAYEVGFSSTSYFVERFKKHIGMPPTAYRKKIADKGVPPSGTDEHRNRFYSPR